MSYSSRSKHSTASVGLALLAVTAAILVVVPLAGCNPFASAPAPPTVTTPTVSASAQTTVVIPTVTVPDVTDLSVEDAQSGLLDKGLLFIVNWHRSASVPALDVYNQTPEAGDETTPGTYVTLYTSIGPKAENPGIRTDAPPKPRKPTWTAVPGKDNVWLLTGVGSGTSSGKSFDNGWIAVTGLVSIPIRVRMDHPDGVQNIMVDTTHSKPSHDIRLNMPPVIREEEVRIARVVRAESGGYKLQVRAGWNQPWILLVRWFEPSAIKQSDIRNRFWP